VNETIKLLIFKVSFLLASNEFPLFRKNTGASKGYAISYLSAFAGYHNGTSYTNKRSSVPYSVAVMATRKNTQGLSLAECLAGLPGMEVQSRYNLSVGDRITNRGFGARTQFGVRGVRIIVDDIPATLADGQSNWK